MSSFSAVPRRIQDDVVAAVESSSPDQISFLTGIDIDPSEDQARQEFRADTDVDTILARHGGAALRPAQPLAGFGQVVDYDTDLGTALRMVAEAKAAYEAAPADIRKRFKSYGAFVEAVQDGRVAVRDAEGAPIPPQRVIVVSEPSSGEGAPSGAPPQPPK